MELYLREDLQDAMLTDKGIKQAKDQQNLINSFKYRQIFVSPFRRAV